MKFCCSCFQAILLEPRPIQIMEISSFPSEEVDKVHMKDGKNKGKGMKYISVPEIGKKSIYLQHAVYFDYRF